MKDPNLNTTKIKILTQQDSTLNQATHLDLK